MKPKTPATNNNIVNIIDIFSYFQKIEKIIIFEEFSPDLIYDLAKFANPEIEFIYAKSDTKCPICGNEMSKNGTEKQKLNKKTQIKLQKYKCKNKNCGNYEMATMIKFKDKYCCYTRAFQEKGIEINEIESISYEKKSELIEKQTGIKIPTSTVYYHQDKNIDKKLDIEENKLNKQLKEKNITYSGYYHYDEQYVHINGELALRLDLIDSLENLPIDFKIIYKKDFQIDNIKTFLNQTLKNLPLEYIITDGHMAYPEIIEEMGVSHRKCVFHFLQSFMMDHLKLIKSRKRKIKRLKTKIKSNERKIKIIEEKKKTNKNTTNITKKRRREKLKKLQRETRTLKQEIINTKKEIKNYDIVKERIKSIFNAKSLKNAKIIFTTLKSEIKAHHELHQKFIKRLEKNFNHLTNHYNNPKLEKTNNNIEIYFRHTLPGPKKRKYKTTKGIEREIRISKIRWIKRNSKINKN